MVSLYALSCLPLAGPAKAVLIPSLNSFQQLGLASKSGVCLPHWTVNSWRAMTVSQHRFYLSSLGLSIGFINYKCAIYV